MVGTNLKAETMKLMEQRSGMEAEMNVIIERLTRPGGPGLSGNLLDSEGFPRADFDIPAVRADRHRLAELRNDHKEITEKVNQNIQVLHSARFISATTKDTGDAGINNLGPSENSTLSGTSTAMDVDVIASRPFAMVDEITEASPAAEDGLQLGDQVVKFGNVEFGENLSQRLPAEAQTNKGRAISMVVLRHGALINLTVTPREWQGRGLLGACWMDSIPKNVEHFQPSLIIPLFLEKLGRKRRALFLLIPSTDFCSLMPFPDHIVDDSRFCRDCWKKMCNCEN